MTDNDAEAHADTSNTGKDRNLPRAGVRPMTSKQRSDLMWLCEQAEIAFDDKLTEAEASRRIEELQAATGLGKPQQAPDIESGLISPDPTGNPGSLGKKEQRAIPKGAPSSA